MYEEGYGDEMEYEEDIEEDEEDNISDEDEDIEGMGHIEGMPGDHGMNVEVIMEEGDDDDDDDSADDDEDEDSDDDEIHAEIIEEVDNLEHLAEDDDLDGWESDHGDDDVEDEEDYEGQAQDEDEGRLHHELDVTGMADGPLGDLVRALGGGEGAVDILERMEEQMEADGLDQGEDDEHVGGEYMEDDDGKSFRTLAIADCVFL